MIDIVVGETEYLCYNHYRDECNNPNKCEFEKCKGRELHIKRNPDFAKLIFDFEFTKYPKKRHEWEN